MPIDDETIHNVVVSLQSIDQETYNLSIQVRQLLNEVIKDRSEAYIKDFQIKKDCVRHSDSVRGVYFEKSQDFAEYLKAIKKQQVKQYRYCEWNDTIYEIDSFIRDGVSYPTPARFSDLTD